jgi:hypothetical protein
LRQRNPHLSTTSLAPTAQSMATRENRNSLGFNRGSGAGFSSHESAPETGSLARALCKS